MLSFTRTNSNGNILFTISAPAVIKINKGTLNSTPSTLSASFQFSYSSLQKNGSYESYLIGYGAPSSVSKYLDVAGSYTLISGGTGASTLQLSNPSPSYSSATANSQTLLSVSSSGYVITWSVTTGLPRYIYFTLTSPSWVIAKTRVNGVGIGAVTNPGAGWFLGKDGTYYPNNSAIYAAPSYYGTNGPMLLPAASYKFSTVMNNTSTNDGTLTIVPA